jgi:ABC-2 type transport system permease protein
VHPVALAPRSRLALAGAFTHLPKVPSAGVTPAPLLLLTVPACAVGGAALAALRRRDLIV